MKDADITRTEYAKKQMKGIEMNIPEILKNYKIKSERLLERFDKFMDYHFHDLYGLDKYDRHD